VLTILVAVGAVVALVLISERVPTIFIPRLVWRGVGFVLVIGATATWGQWESTVCYGLLALLWVLFWPRTRQDRSIAR
jgi:hypothetical protein